MAVWGSMGGWRGRLTVLCGAAVAASIAATPSVQAAATAPAPPAPTTTLPALPPVPPVYTDGQPSSTLLARALTLASLGVDDSALSAAIGSTQAALDADAQKAQAAERAADAASQRAAAARSRAAAAGADYQRLSGALRSAVLQLYMAGPGALTVNPKAGEAALYAQDYAESAVGPFGVLLASRADRSARAHALADASAASKQAASEASTAAGALAGERAEMNQLQVQLASLSTSSRAAVTSDQATLTAQAGQNLVQNSALQFTPGGALPSLISTTAVALTWAFAELGKPYQWGATGPNSFDCSGLTQFVWKQAGVAIPRVAADQDAWAIPVPLSQLLPGDLVFFGKTDIHHVGIYIGNGLMINAPHTGTVVQVSSIWWSDLAGFGRVHMPGTPVPSHATPTPAQPAKPTVVPTLKPVPSQPQPPPGWVPAPGETTPIPISIPLPLPAPTTTVAPPTTTAPSTTTVPGSTTTSSTSSTTSTTVAPGTTTTTSIPAG